MNVLDIKNVSKSFGKIDVLKDVSFSIEKGKIVGLLGKNGSGKTTVLKMINDLLTIDSGEILILGEKVSALTKEKVSLGKLEEFDVNVLELLFMLKNLNK